MVTTLHTLVYLSTSSALMTQDQLQSLLLEARDLNASNGITGVLLYSGKHFMQCIEGPEEALNQTFQRIAASRRHRGIVQLLSGSLESRRFSQWSMGFAQPPEAELLKLSNAQWETTLASPGVASPGFILLDAFWRASQP